MNNRLNSHFFWGPHAPLSALTGAGLLVMASARLAHAILCAGGILWVFIFTALVYYASVKVMPQKGKAVILLFLSSLICSVYILLAGLLNPLLVSGTWFFLVLLPPCCTGSGFFTGMENEQTPEIISKIGMEALCLGLLIIAISLIREPLGLGTLSFPGGIWGIHEIFSDASGTEGFIPIKLLSVSAGGFLILGFLAAAYRHFRSAGPEDKS